MKNPNGYGTVYKLAGRRRRPWAAIVPAGRDENGKLKRKAVGYYATQREALQALAAYNESPNEYAAAMTFADVYAGWHHDKFYGDYSLEKERNYAKAYGHCSVWYDRFFTDVRLADMQALADSLPTYEQAYRLRTLLSQMSDWAIDRDYAVKNYAGAIKIKQSRSGSKERTPYSWDEIRRLAAEPGRVAQIHVVLIYTGCRVSELLDLKRDDCDMEQNCIYIRKSKTDAGVRVIPLHDSIVPIVRAFYEEGNDYVFSTPRGLHYNYNNWQIVASDLMKTLGFSHVTHETRHTFISMLAAAHVDPVFTKKLCGHASTQSLTEAVYTHLGLEDLRREINKLPFPNQNGQNISE